MSLTVAVPRLCSSPVKLQHTVPIAAYQLDRSRPRARSGSRRSDPRRSPTV